MLVGNAQIFYPIAYGKRHYFAKPELKKLAKAEVAASRDITIGIHLWRAALERTYSKELIIPLDSYVVELMQKECNFLRSNEMGDHISIG